MPTSENCGPGLRFARVNSLQFPSENLFDFPLDAQFDTEWALVGIVVELFDEPVRLRIDFAQARHDKRFLAFAQCDLRFEWRKGGHLCALWSMAAADEVVTLSPPF